MSPQDVKVAQPDRVETSSIGALADCTGLFGFLIRERVPAVILRPFLR